MLTDSNHNITQNTYNNNNNSQMNADEKVKQDHCDNDSEAFIVKYRQNYYDISRFMKNHPGGINTLKGLRNGDMTSRFMKAPPHSDAAMYLMKEFEIPKQVNGKNGTSKHSHTLTYSERKLPENGIELVQEDDKNNNQLDESMEHLVDWSKAMLPQIPNITKSYWLWVHKPVDRPLRLFQEPYLEMLTKTPWWIIPSFWIPVILTSVLNDFRINWQSGDMGKISFLVAYFLIGIIFWTLLEYSLHRWVFHMKVGSDSGPWMCTFHFLIHGLHHKVPFDSQRLVFPPLPGVIIASILYTPISFIAPYPRVLLGGALFGYLCYDLMHYYLHYGNPSPGHVYSMKRYHYQHHFAHQDIGYGISSPLWDFIFNTRIQLRKLKYQLRWK